MYKGYVNNVPKGAFVNTIRIFKLLVSNLSHRGRKTVPHKKIKYHIKLNVTKLCKNQILFFCKVSHNKYICKCNSLHNCVKSYFNHCFVGLRTFTTGGGMHSLFKCICRSGANPEKVFHIC